MNEIPEYIQELVDTYGKDYTPASLPKDIERWEIGKCFDASLLLAVKYPDRFSYVEGLAEDPTKPGTWLLHAWLADVRGNAYDPTWYAVNKKGEQVFVPTRYRGIEMPIRAAVAFVSYTQHCGILANRAKAPQLYQECLVNIKHHANEMEQAPGE